MVLVEEVEEAAPLERPVRVVDAATRVEDVEARARGAVGVQRSAALLGGGAARGAAAVRSDALRRPVVTALPLCDPAEAQQGEHEQGRPHEQVLPPLRG